MLTVNTNTLSLITQRYLNFSSSSLKTSIERLSTGFKINKAADNASNLAISKQMNCQISGTTVAQENTQQSIALLDTADGTLDEMTKLANRIRDLSLQSMNGTYSVEERAMMQEEVTKLTEEMYRQRNATKYNGINIFGNTENPVAVGFLERGSSEGSSVTNLEDLAATTGAQITPGAKEIQQLSREEAEAQGYTIIENVDDLINWNGSGKCILMNDIDLAGIAWSASISIKKGAEFNGNGYTISNLTSDKSFLGANAGTIKNLSITGANISGAGNVGILATQNSSGALIENCTVEGSITGSAQNVAGVLALNVGTIKNVTSCVNVCSTYKNTNANVSGFVAVNNGIIDSVKASGTVLTEGNKVGGIIGTVNKSDAVLRNSTSDMTVTGTSNVGGLVGFGGGKIENSFATGEVNGAGTAVGGVQGYAVGAVIKNSYALGNVNNTVNSAGGFVGDVRSGTVISNSYAKGTVTGVGGGGFAGCATGLGNQILQCYSTGDVVSSKAAGGFIGAVYPNNTNVLIENCFSSGVVSNVKNSDVFAGSNARNINIQNCYAYNGQPDLVNMTQTNVTLVPKDWFENSGNLMFLGDAFDYYYSPPELFGNAEEHPEEFIQFQVGANSGEKNILEMNLTFRMNFFSGDVTTRENASKTIDKVDNFKDMLVNKRSEIGTVRNRMESVLQTQSIRVENLSSSHSTIVDTDFAFESANLAKKQILQHATTSLLAQANMMPNIALQLLS